MSNQPGTIEPTKAEVRADAAGEKAREKALRPWFKKKRFIFPLTLVAIIVVVQVANGGSGDTAAPASQSESTNNEGTSTETATETEPEAEDAAAPGIGATLASDDGVSVTLNSLEYGVAVPNDFIIDPKGSLAAIAMDMSNGSTEKLSLSGGSVIAFVGDVEYEAAALLGPGGEWYVYEDINAGLGTPFTAYFDLPTDAQVTSVEFRSSLFDFDPLTFTP